jgi:hypothetical protein
VDWDKVLAAYFLCLSATAPPGKYAERLLGIVDKFQHHTRDRHPSMAKHIGAPSQRQALKKRLNADTPKKARAL